MNKKFNFIRRIIIYDKGNSESCNDKNYGT
mgnify:FL=1